MTRRFVLLLLVVSGLHAYIYNDSLLLIYGKIVPRIMLLDHTNTAEKDTRRLCILYESADRPVAEKLEKMVRQNLPKPLQGSFEVTTASYDEIGLDQKCGDATALMLLDARPDKIAEALKFAKKRRLLTFSYSNTLLQDGTAISLIVGKQIHPIVNINAVKSAGLKLDPMLFQIAKIYNGRSVR